MNMHISTAQVVSELQKFFADQGVTSSAGIAKLTGISQSQIYRNLFGQPKRLTKTIRQLCIYANVSIVVDPVNPATSQVLMDALSVIWDGSEEHARRLADLLFAHRRASMGK